MTDISNNTPTVIRSGASLLDNLMVTHEQVLELLTEEKLVELAELAEEGFTPHELAAHLNISFGEFMLARSKSEDFDSYCQLLETTAAGKHLSSARSGIKNPQGFSAAAYDRVMGALGFVPHVSHVNMGGAASDEDAERLSQTRVGFDVANFMKKHDETEKPREPIDMGNVVKVEDDIEDLL